MPIVSRGYLRRQLGLTRLGDVTVGTRSNSGAWTATTVPSFYITDYWQFGNELASGQNLYQGADIRIVFSVNAVQDCKIASYVAGSGSFVILKSPIVNGGINDKTIFEIHEKLPPADKDRAIDQVITDLWERREIPLAGVDSKTYYSIGPDLKVFGAYYYSDPTDSLSRGRGNFSWWGVGRTATGRELRISPAVQASYQVILDAQVGLTLGNEAATCNIQSEEWVLDGAAAICYDMLAARAPGQEAAAFRERARFYKRRWLAGQVNNAEPADESPRLDEVW